MIILDFLQGLICKGGAYWNLIPISKTELVDHLMCLYLFSISRGINVARWVLNTQTVGEQVSGNWQDHCVFCLYTTNSYGCHCPTLTHGESCYFHPSLIEKTTWNQLFISLRCFYLFTLKSMDQVIYCSSSYLINMFIILHYIYVMLMLLLFRLW